MNLRIGIIAVLREHEPIAILIDIPAVLLFRAVTAHLDGKAE